MKKLIKNKENKKTNLKIIFDKNGDNNLLIEFNLKKNKILFNLLRIFPLNKTMNH